MMDVPAHIPSELVFDFDYYAVPGGTEDVQAAWKTVRDTHPPLFWTPLHGGHWVVTQAEDIEAVLSDYTRFSSSAIRIPPLPTPYPILPNQFDPPRHGAYRALIAQSFSPKAVAQLEPHVREVAIETIEALAPNGSCEFVGDFARVLPVTLFLDIMGLPRSDRDLLLPLADAIARSPDPQESLRARRGVADYISTQIAERRLRPGDDPLSRLVHARIGGEPLPDNEVLGLCATLLSAGLDTVAGMMAFAARLLADEPALRRRIAGEPAIVPRAVEELLRRHGMVVFARTAVADLVFRGVSIRTGEQIAAPNALCGLDEGRNPDPLTVDLDRKNPSHRTFGYGAHLCPGASLARRELAIFLEEWLRRIPDFAIAPGTRPVLVMGTVNSIQELHLVWSTD